MTTINRSRNDYLALPARWLNCPRKSNSLINDKFVAFKVPLSNKFDKNVPIECRFNMSMLIDSVKKSFNSKLGLIIDLTNTSRFYDAENELKKHGIKYVKINCKGHGETPSREVTNIFLNVVETFIRQHPTEKIGVHCTHGFNRTGFLICSYLVEKLDFSIDMAVALFAESRPPGIYKQDYLNELYTRYADDPTCSRLVAPEYPQWDNDSTEKGNEEEDNETNENVINKNNECSSNFSRRSLKRQKIEDTKLSAQFAEPNLKGVETCQDLEEITRVRSEMQSMCSWNGAGFPGAQPVSMYYGNLKYLYEKEYMVSWKADGTRYLMYIRRKDEIYMADRDNSIFKVRNLIFPHRKDMNRHLENTLVDGEFVIDIDPANQQKIPRFLIYDIIKFENEDVGKMNFNIRLICIEKEIIWSRNEAFRLGKIDKQIEPFSIRQKKFYPIQDTRKLLSKEFERQISHGIDGLIFQPVDEQYKGGRCDLILKWKPPSMNSVDFKLVISVNEGYGMLTEKIGYLYVIGYDRPYSSIKVTKAISGLNNKIIECRWNMEEQRWEFMRERLDKSYPNHYNTANAVCESIRNPITEEKLLDTILNVENQKSFILPHNIPKTK